MQPTIIYEDEAILVINKPSGLAVHADGKHDWKTLVDWLAEEYPELKGVGEEQRLPDGTIIERPGIVHRIDRETSGVLVVARTQKSFDALKTQFQERGVKKVYRAFVYGDMTEERGIIDKPIGSGRGGKAPRTAQLSAKGTLRDAQTAYRVISHNKEFSYVEAFPKTGRTHQIRVHFSSIQHPIVADTLYAPGRPPMLGFKRLALHAFSVTFKHPLTGKEVMFEAPLPADFVAAEEELRNR